MLILMTILLKIILIILADDNNKLNCIVISINPDQTRSFLLKYAHGLFSNQSLTL